VKLGLLLAEIGQKAEVQVSDAEFTQAVMNQARQYGPQAKQFFDFVQQNPQMQQQIRAPLPRAGAAFLYVDVVVKMVGCADWSDRATI